MTGGGAPAIVLIDGECGLCRATERWVSRRDRHGRFAFHTLQSEAGEAWLQRMGLPADTRDTMVLVEGERAYVRSTASLRIARRLQAPWPALYGFIVVPRPIRDGVYRLVARNRHRLHPDHCPV